MLCNGSIARRLVRTQQFWDKSNKEIRSKLTPRIVEKTEEPQVLRKQCGSKQKNLIFCAVLYGPYFFLFGNVFLSFLRCKTMQFS
jgi:hypothetical protein